MTGWNRVIGILLFSLWVGGGVAAGEASGPAGRGVTYRGSDPYAALPVARSEGKLLLVEFYADWNHRSRWMSQHVLGDSAVRGLVEARFVPVQVPTGTPQGAELAEIYQVTDYPAILIFHTSGDVLDKIDVTLDAEDFEQRLQAVLMATQGLGSWRLRRVYSAAETGDPVATDAAVGEFLRGQLPQDVANSVVWPMFENGVVMRYGSAAFDYVAAHAAVFRREVGREAVDAVLEEAMRQGMLPYVVGSMPYGAAETERMVRTAERLELPAALSLRAMAEVAALRQGEDMALFAARVGLLMEMLPEQYRLPLALSLEVVAERGSREAKTAARERVNALMLTLSSPAQVGMLRSLRDRLE